MTCQWRWEMFTRAPLTKLSLLMIKKRHVYSTSQAIKNHHRHQSAHWYTLDHDLSQSAIFTARLHSPATNYWDFWRIIFRFPVAAAAAIHPSEYRLILHIHWFHLHLRLTCLIWANQFTFSIFLFQPNKFNKSHENQSHETASCNGAFVATRSVVPPNRRYRHRLRCRHRLRRRYRTATDDDDNVCYNLTWT